MEKEEKKPEKDTKTQAKKEAVSVAKSEVVQSLKVEITFPTITDLKQAIGMDGDGNLVLAVQFKARADQYEIFRLINLLKQPHGVLYATIGSPQSAMDFKFTKEGKVEIVKAQVTAAKKPPELDKPADKPAEEPVKCLKIHDVIFNHIPEDPNPYGVMIEYMADGTGEIKTAAGRGQNPTEAVLQGVHNCGAVAADLKEPFEVRAELEKLEPSPANYKLIRVLDVGSFDVNDKGESEQPTKGD